MARRKSGGKRTENGKRLSRSKVALTERNPPSEKVVARQERFRHFMGDGSIGHEMTAAGRLMLVGAFDGMELAPEVYLSALLEYGNGYWSYYGGGSKVAAYERQDRSYDTVWEDPRGERFDAADERLRSAGHDVRMAVHEVTVDRHWFPDEDSGWASRIINSRILDKRAALVKAGKPVPAELFVAGELACDSDWAMLELLRSGALVLAMGSAERRRAA